MSTIPNTQLIFDGKQYAEQLERELKISGVLMGKKLLILTSDTESVYVRLKKEMGDRLGVIVEVQMTNDKLQIGEQIQKNKDSVDGILIQLPIEGMTKEETEEVLKMIPADKDVDGLNVASGVLPAVVRAVDMVIESNELQIESMAVVGAKGMVGRRMVEIMRSKGYLVGEFDKGDDLNELVNFNCVISATGVAELIKPVMVAEGFVGIDLGYPEGDISWEAGEIASFVTPVPGGIGPVTVVCLFENLSIL